MTPSSCTALPGIRARRQAQGLKQAEAARLIGVSRVAYANWEAGRASPAVRFLPVIADVLGCTIEQLYSAEECDAPRRSE